MVRNAFAALIVAMGCLILAVALQVAQGNGLAIDISLSLVKGDAKVSVQLKD